MSVVIIQRRSAPVRTHGFRQLRTVIGSVLLTVLVGWIALLYLTPLYEAVLKSVSTSATEPGQPRYPSMGKTFSYQGQKLDLYRVPLGGATRELALLEPSRSESVFVDPANPTQKITWQGRYRQLERVWVFAPQWQNFSQAWNKINFGRLLFNTFMLALISSVGVVVSGVLVAYGFARFRVPGKNRLMALLTLTMMLPREVLFVPTYILFFKIGWVGTWLPMLVPAFFGTAYSIFLLRQFFQNVPRELDEAAMIDGASPLRILWSIIVPLSLPAIIAVGIINFVFVWNDFFSPTLYLAGKSELMPLAPALRSFSSNYGSTEPQLISAASMLASIFPILLFLLAQRPFVRAVMMPGLDK